MGNKKGNRKHQHQKNNKGKQSKNTQSSHSYNTLNDDDEYDNNGNSNRNKNRSNNNRNKKKQSKDQSRFDDHTLRQSIIGESGKRNVVDMASDGNCLFRSLSDQLYHDYGNNHDTVRNDICNFLSDHEEDFAIFLLLDDDNGFGNGEVDVREFNSYVQEMRENGTWGGDVEIACAARLYRRRITVFSSVGAYHIGIGDDTITPSGPDLQISYHENSHYNSVHDEAIERSLGNRYNPPTYFDTLNDSIVNDNFHKSGRTSKLSKQKKAKKNKELKNDQLSKVTEVLVKGDVAENGTAIPQTSIDNGTNDVNDQNDQVAITNENILREEDAKKSVGVLKQQRRNELCGCGSGLRYKKCCLEAEKRSVRLQKWKEKHGLDQGDKNYSAASTLRDEEREKLEGGFSVLTI